MVQIGGEQIRAKQVAARKIGLREVLADQIGARQLNDRFQAKECHLPGGNVVEPRQQTVGAADVADQPFARKNPVR